MAPGSTSAIPGTRTIRPHHRRRQRNKNVQLYVYDGYVGYVGPDVPDALGRRSATMCYMGTARRTPNAEETVGVRELRQNLSVYLARLAAGVTFRVTDRGRAVALLVPLPAETSVVARLVASGRATPAKHDLLRLPKLKGRASRSNASRLPDALNDVRQDIV